MPRPAALSIPKAVVEEILERALHHCEACGWPAAGKMDLHHRLLRSHGGQDSVANLIWVHHTCHVITPWSIHQNPALSYDLGHMVRTGDDPADIAVQVDLRMRTRTRYSGLIT